VVVAVLLVVVGPAGLTVKPEAATAVVELLMMGVGTPETCRTVHKRQVIKLIVASGWLFYLNCLKLSLTKHKLRNIRKIYTCLVVGLSKVIMLQQ
jgi:hypothetical protein